MKQDLHIRSHAAHDLETSRHARLFELLAQSARARDLRGRQERLNVRRLNAAEMHRLREMAAASLSRR